MATFNPPLLLLTLYLGLKMNAETENGELVKPGWYQVNLQDISGNLKLL